VGHRQRTNPSIPWRGALSKHSATATTAPSPSLPGDTLKVATGAERKDSTAHFISHIRVYESYSRFGTDTDDAFKGYSRNERDGVQLVIWLKRSVRPRGALLYVRCFPRLPRQGATTGRCHVTGNWFFDLLRVGCLRGVIANFSMRHRSKRTSA